MWCRPAQRSATDSDEALKIFLQAVLRDFFGPPNNAKLLPEQQWFNSWLAFRQHGNAAPSV
ncbi:hypothetical protein AL047_24985 [Pseudomonas syringae pv. broussonetiae]|nr:hypothetical protein AL047_24985 [Pseudomonas syringae pv. broussonetiae]